eukprot:TRINITY_DN2729_c0_g1_i2.p1 TRINITY_DN2729_c0_g1~~TRINITY_DN2729_c0_g1_i2.p1  ORF type:complete len:128 (-),score=20.39 TRINITY_DN2729_c0_g1_i2:61-444(-)
MSHRRAGNPYTLEEERKKLGLDSTMNSSRWAENSAQLLAQDNERKIDELAQTVTRMKSSVSQFQRELSKGDALLIDIDTGTEEAQGTLQSNMNRIGKIMETGSFRHIIVLAVFTIFIFFLVWWLSKA